MRTIDRYVALIFVKNFLLSLLGLTAVYVFQTFMGELLDQSYPSHQVVVYTLLDVPNIMVQLMPPGVLIATVFTFSSLNRTNELTACYSLGFGLRRLLAIVLSLVFMVSCITLMMQDRILPPVFKKRTIYYYREMKQRRDFFLDVKRDKIWYRSKNLIYNLRSFDTKSSTIHGMAVYTFDEQFKLVQVIDAERATYTPDGWRLMNGVVTVFTQEDPFPYTQKFEQKDVIINETPKDFQEIEKEVDGLRLRELYGYIQRIKDAGADTKTYEVKFHSRLSMSFIPMVMCILGIPFSIRNRREGGMAKDLGICLGITFFYWLFYSVGLSLGTNGALPPWLAAWLPSTIFAALAAVLIARQRV